MIPSLEKLLSDPELEAQRVEAFSYMSQIMKPTSRSWSAPDNIETDNPVIKEFCNMCHTKQKILTQQMRKRIMTKLYNLKMSKVRHYANHNV